MYHLRDGHKKKIDLLIYENNTLYPIEIRASAEPDPSDIKSFTMLDDVKNVNVGEGGVVCLAKELLPLKGKHKIIPVWAV